MKKIIFILVLLISILFTLLFLISKNKVIEYEYMTILESKSYVFKEGRKIDFNVYCNKKDSLISFPEKNTYSLKLNDMIIPLNSIEITTGVVDGYYLIKIEADMPNITNDEFICKDARLIVENSKYNLELKIGSLSFLNSNKYELLSVQSLYASFSNINDNKHLVGINLKLTNKYKSIEYFKLGGLSFGVLSKIKYSVLYDNEIEISNIIKGYHINYVEAQISQRLEDNILFIPISYDTVYLQRGGYIIISLDNQYYYLDSFNYMLDIPSLNNYENLIAKGNINYDKHS